MPYLRLYSRDIGIEQKRVIARKLIQITQHAFHLRPEECGRITIQFVPPPQGGGINGLHPAIPQGSELMLEVLAHDMTTEKKSQFAEEAAATLADLLPETSSRLIARLFGIKPHNPSRVALQFNDLSPAVSDPFVPDQRWAA